ncbi:MAG: ribonuclease HII [Actinomycetota bacterium]|nr:ribonuclease HII [Actinomycetota bacterium]
MHGPRSRAPKLTEERRCWDEGEHLVVGVDEVGRGAWAGPLTVGAVVLPKAGRVNGVRDSKLLSPAQRELLFDRIADWALGWSVGHASDRECDELGMSDAQRLATRRAIDALPVQPDRVLLDGNWNYIDYLPSRTLVKGDLTCLSIAAASIMAKVVRDRLMIEAAQHHPAYGFDGNKGYPAPDHVMALAGYGPSSIHRRSWAFMDNLPWTAVQRYRRDTANQGQLFAA